MTNASTTRKTAVVLFNLGGPDNQDAVRPFLFNLFYDPSIMRVPNPLRFLLATLISRRRTHEASEIYAQLGGGSPLLPNTEAQARALEAELSDLGETRVFIAMRYWHPMSDETAYQVKDFDPDQVVLLPLYPQFSTTTTASSLRVWRQAAKAAGLDKPTRLVCCYPDEPGLIDANVRLIEAAWREASAFGRPRLLFSSHGLPEKIVKDGDPYQWQCERTAAAIVERLGIPDLDWVTCYQSRVGPLKWIGPSTEDEVIRAGADRVPLIVAPIAFVSEHSETLYEIGMQYRDLAREKGVPFFARVPAVGDDAAFIRGLGRLVRESLGRPPAICSENGSRLCPDCWSGCPVGNIS
jgi:ferrochelatase